MARSSSYLEEGYANALLRHLDDRFEPSRFIYQPKGFDVSKFPDETWLISTEEAFFYPDAPIIGYLEKFYFASTIVDDECNLIVKLGEFFFDSACIDEIDNYNYVGQSFEKARRFFLSIKKLKKSGSKPKKNY